MPTIRTFRHLSNAASGPIAAVASDTVAGNELGLSGTPLLLINDLVVPYYPGKEKLASYVRRALSAARKEAP